MATSRFLRTKDVDDVIRQNDDPVGGEAHHTRLSKRLTAWDLMGFGIGIVIGTGIFTLTGIQAKNNAGPAIVVSFAIAGVVSLLAALCYAELAAAVPTAGSSYTYAYTTIGEIFAWIIALGPDPGVRARRRGGLAGLVGLPPGRAEPADLGLRRGVDGQPRGDRDRPGARRGGDDRHPRVRVGHQRAGRRQGLGLRLRDRARHLLRQGREPLPVRPASRPVPTARRSAASSSRCGSGSAAPTRRRTA